MKPRPFPGSTRKGPAESRHAAVEMMRRCPRSRLKQVDYSGLRILVHLDELVAGDTGLGADRPQGRPFDPWMIRHRERSPGAVGILANHRYVLTFPDDLKAKESERLDDFRFRGVVRKVRHHTAIAVSAMNASRTMDSFSKMELPNVSAWNRTADLTSANASS